MKNPPIANCAGCGIPLSDGYALGCAHCQNRRYHRLRQGHLTSPTGYPGELIDNQDPRERLLVGVA
jgi:hypothetical protein